MSAAFRKLLVACCAASLLFSAPVLALDASLLTPSVVRIVMVSYGSTGSGFIVSRRDGKCIIATNCHVVTDDDGDVGEDLVVARRKGGAIEAIPGRVIFFDDCLDLALVEVDGLSGSPLPLNVTEPARGTEVASLGFPGVGDMFTQGEQSDDEPVKDEGVIFGELAKLAKEGGGVMRNPPGYMAQYFEPSLSQAVVRRVIKGKWKDDCDEPAFAIIEHDVNITGGNSGGPLLNACGQVVGVNTMLVSPTPVEILRRSSHAKTLFEVMRRNGVQAQVASGPCDPGRWASFSLWAFAGLAGLASLAALFVALRKPSIIRETYTQFLRRGGKILHREDGLSGRSIPRNLENVAGQPDHPAESQPAAVPPHRTPTTGPAWTFEGGTAAHPVRLHLSAAQLVRGNMVVGRRPGHVHLLLQDPSISGLHASFSLMGETLRVEDLGSSNGTRVNGQRLLPHRPFALRRGDTLELGEVLLHLV